MAKSKKLNRMVQSFQDSLVEAGFDAAYCNITDDVFCVCVRRSVEPIDEEFHEALINFVDEWGGTQHDDEPNVVEALASALDSVG